MYKYPHVRMYSSIEQQVSKMQKCDCFWHQPIEKYFVIFG